MPEGTRTLPPTPRTEDGAEEARTPDVVPWEPPLPSGMEPPPLPGTEPQPLPQAEPQPLPRAESQPLPRTEPQTFPRVELPTPPRTERQTFPRVELPAPPQAERQGPSGTGAAESPPGRPTPPLDQPLPVLMLAEEARSVPEAERPEVASRLNVQLKRMAAQGGERRVADTFHQLLESGKLEGLEDAEGRSCRAVAVESLLSLGFPFALEVRPEDLEHLRANRPRKKGRKKGARRAAVVPGAVLAAGVVAEFLVDPVKGRTTETSVTFQVGLSLLALMALWLAPPRSPVYRLGLGLLALVSGFAVLMSLLTSGHIGALWAGLAGLVAALLAALREG